MKHLYSYITILSMMLICGIGLTSCEDIEDEGVGYQLQGHWFGDLDMYYDGIPARGSDIIFYPQGWGYTRGTGTQIDYYGRYGYTQVRHDFSYYVENGIIYFTFYDEPDLDCTISNYGLNTEYFWGRIDGRYSSTDFRLKNYDRYWSSDGYGYPDYTYDELYYSDYYHTPYYYTKGEQHADLWTDSIAVDSSSTQQETTRPKATRGVNQAAE